MRFSWLSSLLSSHQGFSIFPCVSKSLRVQSAFYFCPQLSIDSFQLPVPKCRAAAQKLGVSYALTGGAASRFLLRCFLAPNPLLPPSLQSDFGNGGSLEALHSWPHSAVGAQAQFQPGIDPELFPETGTCPTCRFHDMGSFSTSGWDPAFWSHHYNVVSTLQRLSFSNPPRTRFSFRRQVHLFKARTALLQRL